MYVIVASYAKPQSRSRHTTNTCTITHIINSVATTNPLLGIGSSSSYHLCTLLHGEHPSAGSNGGFDFNVGRICRTLAIVSQSSKQAICESHLPTGRRRDEGSEVGSGRGRRSPEDMRYVLESLTEARKVRIRLSCLQAVSMSSIESIPIESKRNQFRVGDPQSHFAWRRRRPSAPMRRNKLMVVLNGIK